MSHPEFSWTSSSRQRVGKEGHPGKGKCRQKGLLSYTVENENTEKAQEAFDIDAVQV